MTHPSLFGVACSLALTPTESPVTPSPQSRRCLLKSTPLWKSFFFLIIANLCISELCFHRNGLRGRLQLFRRTAAIQKVSSKVPFFAFSSCFSYWRPKSSKVLWAKWLCKALASKLWVISALQGFFFPPKAVGCYNFEFFTQKTTNKSDLFPSFLHFSSR